MFTASHPLDRRGDIKGGYTLGIAVCRTVVILNSVVGVGSQVFAIQE